LGGRRFLTNQRKGPNGLTMGIWFEPKKNKDGRCFTFRHEQGFRIFCETPSRMTRQTPMIQHQAIHNGNGTKLKLALGLATILLTGCKTFYSPWDSHWMDIGGGSCGCESTTVVSRSSPIASERISPVPVVSEPPLATSPSVTTKSMPITTQGPVLTPTPTQVPLGNK